MFASTKSPTLKLHVMEEEEGGGGKQAWCLIVNQAVVFPYVLDYNFMTKINSIITVIQKLLMWQHSDLRP